MTETLDTNQDQGAPPPDLDRIVSRSEMVERPGFLFRLLFRFFRRVTFDLNEVNRINDAARNGHVVYVCDRQSTLDYLYFNYAFAQFALPLAYFANGVRTLMYRPLHRALGYLFKRLFRRIHIRLDDKGKLAASIHAGRANLLFLRRRRTLVQWGSDSVTGNLRALVELQAELDRPILLVPIAVHWGRRPERYRRSVFDFVFGDPNAPGRIRKAIGFLRNHRWALVQVGEPIDLRERLAEDEVPSAAEHVAEQVRWSLHRGLSDVARPLRGPILKGAKRVCDEIMRNDAFRESLRLFAEREKRSIKSVEKTTRSYLKEIAADFRIGGVEAFCVVLTFIWNRSFAGLDIDLEGLNRIREAAKRGPIMLVPGHRSHIDYLVISWVFYIHGLIPPHIAAGINLSFWPIGAWFRRSGAFFIRRSFRGNRVYAMALAAYLRKLVKEGYWIEFFIEGGRSRNGKSLPPKLGLLSQIVDAYLDGATRDLSFVPVSIGYERIIEEGAYSREMSGAEKSAENIRGLLKSGRVLRTRYGRLHVQFGEPMSLGDYLGANGVEDRTTVETEQRRALIERLGASIVQGIDQTTVVTSSALVATALLCHPKRGISSHALQMRVGLMLEVASRAGAPLASALRVGLQARRLAITRAEEEAADSASDVPRYQRQRGIDAARGDAVKEVLGSVLKEFLNQKMIVVDRVDDRAVYRPVEEHRLSFSIYKNAFMHVLVGYGVYATSLLMHEREGRAPRSDVRDTASFLFDLFRLEFVCPDPDDLDARLGPAEELFAHLGLVRAAADDDTPFEIHEKAMHLLRFFRNTTANFVESYRFVAAVLSDELATPVGRRDLVKRLQKRGDRAFKEGDIQLREAISSVDFQHALERFEQLGLLGRVDDETSSRAPLRILDAEGLQDLAARLKKLYPS